MPATPEFDTATALIRVTTAHLLAGDESEIRVLDICQETQLSTSVIYGHFRSRQGLINATLLAIYRDVTASMARLLDEMSERARERGSFVAALFAVLEDPTHGAEVARNRQMHLRISASALARPALRPTFLEIYRAYQAYGDRLFATMIDEGLLSPDLTARQWSLFFEGQMFSRAFHDVELAPLEHDDWRVTAEHAANARATSSS